MTELELLRQDFAEQEALLQDALATIDVLSDAIDSIYNIAKSFPLDQCSLSIRDIAYKAIKQALKTMES